jgi:3-dehydroquinate synthase
MKPIHISFSGTATDVYFQADLSAQLSVCSASVFIIADAQVQALHGHKWLQYPVFTIPSGEQHKQQATVDMLVAQLMAAGADRHAFIMGIGGGMATDIAGYVAGIYMRGVHFGLAPTTLLGMVDAAIGGKNGIDVGSYKNMVGLIRHPQRLFYDDAFLDTLPEAEWINGFAEIIKHAAVFDADLFAFLEAHVLSDFRSNRLLLQALIRENVLLKAGIVQQDEQEQGIRKILNFGHTLGHAIENDYRLPHGHAVALGMVSAARISEQINGFADTQRLINLLQQYGLPVSFAYDRERVWQRIQADKKKAGNSIQFVLLEQIGQAVIMPIPAADLYVYL